jgi:L-lactate dehydrogenase complex protein LldG
MTSTARNNILQRLRSAPQGKPPLAPDVHGFYATARNAAPAEDRAARIERFCEKMAFWRGEVVRVTHSNWAESLRALCVAKNVNSLLYGAQTAQAAALEAADINGLKPYDRPVDDWKPELFRDTDAGFTSTRGGITETGTLILWPDEKEPRLMSLVPPIHFALLDASQLYDNFFDAMTGQGWSGDEASAGISKMPTNALLISGPSKTADIQVTLAYGAHGPKELVILLVVNEEEL